ncbi:hypothetical protein Fmac_015740 [Flemingia macrophylla]|uniref:Uncharacterized protein n=1 Tax=Flemingia macrophylla TaxID=520843 RepID=A0ABD1MFF0_9FABA
MCARPLSRRCSVATCSHLMLELLDLDTPTADDASEGDVICTDKWKLRDPNSNFWLLGNSASNTKCKHFEELAKLQTTTTDLNLRLTLTFLQNARAEKFGGRDRRR